MASRYDLPSSFRAYNPFRYSATPILLNLGGFSEVMKVGAGPISPSKFGIRHVAIEILSFSAFTVARCSMLLYTPFVTIYQNIYIHSILGKLKFKKKIKGTIFLPQECHQC